MQKVSVIVPIYNVDSFLEQGLDSILGQSYGNLEIILIDDGSTDKSGEKCDRIAAQNASVIAMHQSNAGVSSARNKGIELATGDFITFVDPDDIIDLDMIDMLYSRLHQYNADVSVCSIKRFDDGEAIVRDDRPEQVKILDGVEAVNDMLYRKNIALGPVAKLYRAKLLKDHGFNEGMRIAEDADLNYRVLLSAARVVTNDAHKYHYRQRSNSAIRSNFSLKKMDGILVFETILRDVISNHPTLIAAAKNRLFLEAIYVIYHTYRNRNFTKEFERCLSIVKALRLDVLKDAQSHVRIRQYALISINIGLLVHLMRFMNRVKV